MGNTLQLAIYRSFNKLKMKDKIGPYPYHFAAILWIRLVYSYKQWWNTSGERLPISVPYSEGEFIRLDNLEAALDIDNVHAATEIRKAFELIVPGGGGLLVGGRNIGEIFDFEALFPIQSDGCMNEVLQSMLIAASGEDYKGIIGNSVFQQRLIEGDLGDSCAEKGVSDAVWKVVCLCGSYMTEFLDAHSQGWLRHYVLPQSISRLVGYCLRFVHEEEVVVPLFGSGNLAMAMAKSYDRWIFIDDNPYLVALTALNLYMSGCMHAKVKFSVLDELAFAESAAYPFAAACMPFKYETCFFNDRKSVVRYLTDLYGCMRVPWRNTEENDHWVEMIKALNAESVLEMADERWLFTFLLLSQSPNGAYVILPQPMLEAGGHHEMMRRLIFSLKALNSIVLLPKRLFDGVEQSVALLIFDSILHRSVEDAESITCGVRARYSWRRVLMIDASECYRSLDRVNFLDQNSIIELATIIRDGLPLVSSKNRNEDSIEMSADYIDFDEIAEEGFSFFPKSYLWKRDMTAREKNEIEKLKKEVSILESTADKLLQDIEDRLASWPGR